MRNHATTLGHIFLVALVLFLIVRLSYAFVGVY